MELDSTSILLEVEEVLNPNVIFNASDVGRHLAGAYGVNACAGVEATSPLVGDVVLAAIDANNYRSEYCPGIANCDDTCAERSPPDPYEECNERCTAACTPDRGLDLIAEYVEIRPWQDLFNVGSGVLVSVEEAAELSDGAACTERFPPPPSEPCRDTDLRDRTEEGCAVAPGSTRRGSGSTWGLVLLAALMACRALTSGD